MKKILIVIGAAVLLTGLLVAASGCGGTATADSSSKLTQDKYAKLDEGMTNPQIRSIAGEPSKIEKKQTAGGHQMEGMTMGDAMTVENWYYQGDKGWVRLEVTDGQLTKKSGY